MMIEPFSQPQFPPAFFKAAAASPYQEKLLIGFLLITIK
jgi:hypothetical protein